MATLASEYATLIDLTKRLNPNGSVETEISEMLTQSNPLLDDLMFKEGNEITGHQVTIRTGLPESYFRKINQGVAASKSTTVQVKEATAMLEAHSKIDGKLAQLNGNTAAWRLSEQKPFIESLNQKLNYALLYGDHTVNPEQFMGLAPRFDTISGAVNGDNILDAGGTGSDNTSIWLVGHGQEGVFGIYPKGSQGGLKHINEKDGSGDGMMPLTDADGLTFRGYSDRYQWDCGLVVKDWRTVVRIANIDISDLLALATTQATTAATNIIDLMSRSIDRLPDGLGIKPVFYANRTIFSMLRVMARRMASSALGIVDGFDQFGKSRKELQFDGFSVRKMDQLLSTETRIT